MAKTIKPLHYTEALPCPFCGIHPEIQRWHGGDSGHTLMIFCDQNDCPVNPQVTAGTRRTVRKRWNTRNGVVCL